MPPSLLADARSDAHCLAIKIYLGHFRERDWRCNKYSMDQSLELEVGEGVLGRTQLALLLALARPPHPQRFVGTQSSDFCVFGGVDSQGDDAIGVSDQSVRQLLPMATPDLADSAFAAVGSHQIASTAAPSETSDLTFPIDGELPLFGLAVPADDLVVIAASAGSEDVDLPGTPLQSFDCAPVEAVITEVVFIAQVPDQHFSVVRSRSHLPHPHTHAAHFLPVRHQLQHAGTLEAQIVVDDGSIVGAGDETPLLGVVDASHSAQLLPEGADGPQHFQVDD